jgi:hypothetical protein
MGNVQRKFSYNHTEHVLESVELHVIKIEVFFHATMP